MKSMQKLWGKKVSDIDFRKHTFVNYPTAKAIGAVLVGVGWLTQVIGAFTGYTN
ncbi:hypothetical protein HPSNT_08064 (plasmid) [Helicobacter pylori SNT49]|uniref:Uncharacterized protein n=2 Tax=Helicobacter pylori TaxID=210 RepID=G2MFT8_HELPX|nr:hypothetical protein HPSNT_08064 [Helicobacter pylori SNT49]